MNKKIGVYLFLFIILLIPLISAQDFRYTLDRIAEGARPVAGWLIGDISDGEHLLIKFLVFIIVLSLVKISLARTPLGDDKKILAVISIAASLMAVRYLTTEEWINFIWLPYGGLGVLLASILPFIIFFFFIEGFNEDVIRKIGWVAFVCIYLGLAYVKYADFSVGNEWWENLALIYLLIALVSLGIMLFEGKIRRIMLISSIKRGFDTKNIVLRDELKRELEKINKTLSSTMLSSREANKLKDEKNRIVHAIARIS